MLWDVRHEWPSGAQFTLNCYRHWATLVVRDTRDGSVHFLHSKEGVTQEDPLALIAYGIGVLPLIRELWGSHPASHNRGTRMARGWDPRSSLMRGRTPIPYAIMARGSPWVTPSLIYKKLPEPSPVSRTTSVAQWWYQLNVNFTQLGHSCRTTHNMAVRFSLLKEYHASMMRNPQSSSCVCSSQRTRIAQMAPYIPASTPPASGMVPQAAFASVPVTRSRHFAISLHQVSPTLTDLIPGCLSRAISRPLISALWAAHGGRPFPIHFIKSPTINRSYPLAAPNRRSQCCSETDSVPPGPAPPESRPATAITMSSVMSIGVIYRGWAGYKSKIAAVGVRAYGCLERKRVTPVDC